MAKFVQRMAEIDVRIRRSGIQFGRAPACHGGGLAHAEFAQGSAKREMDVGVTGLQINAAPEGDYRRIEPADLAQCIAKTHSGWQQLLIELKRPSVMFGRALRVAARGEHVGEMTLHTRRARFNCGRPLQEFDCLSQVSAHPGGIAGEMQHVAVLGLAGEEVSINSLGVLNPAVFFQVKRQPDPVHVPARESSATQRFAPQPVQQIVDQLAQHCARSMSILARPAGDVGNSLITECLLMVLAGRQRGSPGTLVS
ncbi:MAG: hypothetical protein ABI547_09520 [Betaproteobacteria bacterium]